MSEYQIKPNNYVEPEVRKEVVQRLINFFTKYNGLASSITIGGHCAFKGLKRDIEHNRDVIYTCYEQVLNGDILNMCFQSNHLLNTISS